MTEMCPTCRRDHPPTEPHLWGSQRTQPAPPDFGDPNQNVTVAELWQGLKHWQARALAAEATLEARRAHERDRKKRNRKKATP